MNPEKRAAQRINQQEKLLEVHRTRERRLKELLQEWDAKPADEKQFEPFYRAMYAAVHGGSRFKLTADLVVKMQKAKVCRTNKHAHTHTHTRPSLFFNLPLKLFIPLPSPLPLAEKGQQWTKELGMCGAVGQAMAVVVTQARSAPAASGGSCWGVVLLNIPHNIQSSPTTSSCPAS